MRKCKGTIRHVLDQSFSSAKIVISLEAKRGFIELTLLQENGAWDRRIFPGNLPGKKVKVWYRPGMVYEVELAEPLPVGEDPIILWQTATAGAWPEISADARNKIVNQLCKKINDRLKEVALEFFEISLPMMGITIPTAEAILWIQDSGDDELKKLILDLKELAPGFFSDPRLQFVGATKEEIRAGKPGGFDDSSRAEDLVTALERKNHFFRLGRRI